MFRSRCLASAIAWISLDFEDRCRIMNTLPPELHNYICELACSEDGTTIRSLNMVSPYFNEVTKPFLYRNIAVSSIEQISALSERLSAVPVHLRQIRNMFISDTPSSPGPSHSENSTKLLRAIVQILALAAPTLLSLALACRSPISTAVFASVFRTTFPVLRRLTLSGFYPYPSFPNKFPKLEYLHLNGNRNPSGILEMWILEEACPSLSTLQVTGLSSAGSFVAELEEATRASELADSLALDSTDLTARFPPHLKVLIVQAGPVPDRVLGETLLLNDKVMMDGLWALKTRNGGGGAIKISLLERAKRPLSAEDVKKQWGESMRP